MADIAHFLSLQLVSLCLQIILFITFLTSPSSIFLFTLCIFLLSSTISFLSLSFTISPSQFVPLSSVLPLPVHPRSPLFTPHSPLSLPPQGQPDGHQGAVVSSMEDCRSGAKWPLNGSQTHTGFIDALARRQLASALCVCVCQGESAADCYVDYTE